MKLKNHKLSILRAASLGALVTAAGSASAQLVVTPVTTEITAAAVAVGTIGAAIAAGPAVMRAAWGWIKSIIR